MVRILVLCLAFVLLAGTLAHAQGGGEGGGLTIPSITIGGGNDNGNGEPKDVVMPLEILMLMTTLSLAPYILVMTTSFIRITIVLSFLKTAMGTQQVPPTQVLMGLAMFMTFYIMQPVGARINHDALQPYFRKEIKQPEFFKRLQSPLKEFMFVNCKPRDVEMFLEFADMKNVKISSADDVPIHVMLPAFVTSEIKTAFAIGFLLYIPFLVIDMVVASVLMSMGMFMLSPMSISLPFKLLLFVMINGWELIIKGLIQSFKPIHAVATGGG